MFRKLPFPFRIGMSIATFVLAGVLIASFGLGFIVVIVLVAGAAKLIS